MLGPEVTVGVGTGLAADVLTILESVPNVWFEEPLAVTVTV